MILDKTVKLWKISERERKVAEDAWNIPRHDRSRFTGQLQIPSIVPMELIVEASPRRVYGNAHTYHVNSISVNSDQVYLSSFFLCIKLSKWISVGLSQLKRLCEKSREIRDKTQFSMRNVETTKSQNSGSRNSVHERIPTPFFCNSNSSDTNVWGFWHINQIGNS